MQNEAVKKAAAAYADEMGRGVSIAHILNHGTEALAYAYAIDEGESFALLLVRDGGPFAPVWTVVEDSISEDEYLRNVTRDGIPTSVFFDAVMAAEAGPVAGARGEK